MYYYKLGSMPYTLNFLLQNRGKKKKESWSEAHKIKYDAEDLPQCRGKVVALC